MARRAASPIVSADALDLSEALGSDPELQAMKAQATDAFRTAFTTTMDNLPARERLLLQYEVADGLGRDEIAELFGVHPSSISRWRQSAGAPFARLSAGTCPNASKSPRGSSIASCG